MLTDSQCRTAKCKDKPYKLTDGKGLYLEVKPNGMKAWRYRFKLTKAGKATESIFAIGEYSYAPPGETKEQAKARRDGKRFTLAEARDERAKARALVQQGINPAHNRRLDRIKREHDNATTFEAVAREWLALKDWEEVTKARRLDMLQRVVFPKIGVLPVKQVTPVHVLDVLNAALKKNGPCGGSQTHHVRRVRTGRVDAAAGAQVSGLGWQILSARDTHDREHATERNGILLGLDRAAARPYGTQRGAAHLQPCRLFCRSRQDDAALGGHVGCLEGRREGVAASGGFYRIRCVSRQTRSRRIARSTLMPVHQKISLPAYSVRC